MEAIIAQLLIVYSVNVLLVVTGFSQLAQLFQYFLQIIVEHRILGHRTLENKTLEQRRLEH